MTVNTRALPPDWWPRTRLRVLLVSCASMTLALLLAGSGFGASTTMCCTPVSGALRVAPLGVSPVVWYDATHPPPPLTEQITEIAGNLRPGSSGRMGAVVKNVSTSDGIPAIEIRDLTGSSLLASSIEATITYESSLAPGHVYLVGRGTLQSLQAEGSLRAPVRLVPYTRARPDLGTWRIDVGLPARAGNEIMGLRCVCSVRFTLTQADCRR